MGNSRDSAWIVLAAACALVVHLFLAGIANAAVAGAGDLVLCSGVGNITVPDPDQPREHQHLAHCCLTSCPAADGHADLAIVAIVFPPQDHGRLAADPGGEDRSDARYERSPINPRGPPFPG